VLERMTEILSLLRDTWSLLFSSMAGGARRRADVVVSLLAVLELCRQGKIRTQQTELFGDIVIERQPEISQRDVKVPGDQQEIPDEAKEPGGHNVRSQVRLFGGSAHLAPEAESAECAATQVAQPRTLGLAIQNETAGFQNERIGLDGCTIAE